MDKLECLSHDVKDFLDVCFCDVSSDMSLNDFPNQLEPCSLGCSGTNEFPPASNQLFGDFSVNSGSEPTQFGNYNQKFPCTLSSLPAWFPQPSSNTECRSSVTESPGYSLDSTKERKVTSTSANSCDSLLNFDCDCFFADLPEASSKTPVAQDGNHSERQRKRMRTTELDTSKRCDHILIPKTLSFCPQMCLSKVEPVRPQTEAKESGKLIQHSTTWVLQYVKGFAEKAEKFFEATHASKQPNSLFEQTESSLNGIQAELKEKFPAIQLQDIRSIKRSIGVQCNQLEILLRPSATHFKEHNHNVFSTCSSHRSMSMLHNMPERTGDSNSKCRSATQKIQHQGGFVKSDPCDAYEDLHSPEKTCQNLSMAEYGSTGGDGHVEERSGNIQGRRLNPRRGSTAMHIMACYALRRLPNNEGTLNEIGEIITLNHVFSSKLDWSPRPGTKNYPRW
eukprot:CAMPEP_0177608432 /NCGR_PEP_ID=MMETSP0419_2-20121207/18470_1 /TAXON_ID=582737 /ORGANISM="Tetraselmis sp., Strain GSL018" /LENGTH=449 /DNA_ID=CAMNT_0019103125 /DNA_START=172 /DNA_END=1518 /DNA_ORIENTATION=-